MGLQAGGRGTAGAAARSTAAWSAMPSQSQPGSRAARAACSDPRPCWHEAPRIAAAHLAASSSGWRWWAWRRRLRPPVTGHRLCSSICQQLGSMWDATEGSEPTPGDRRFGCRRATCARGRRSLPETAVDSWHRQWDWWEDPLRTAGAADRRSCSFPRPGLEQPCSRGQASSHHACSCVVAIRAPGGPARGHSLQREQPRSGHGSAGDVQRIWGSIAKMMARQWALWERTGPRCGASSPSPHGCRSSCRRSPSLGAGAWAKPWWTWVTART